LFNKENNTFDIFYIPTFYAAILSIIPFTDNISPIQDCNYNLSQDSQFNNQWQNPVYIPRWFIYI